MSGQGPHSASSGAPSSLYASIVTVARSTLGGSNAGGAAAITAGTSSSRSGALGSAGGADRVAGGVRVSPPSRASMGSSLLLPGGANQLSRQLSTGEISEARTTSTAANLRAGFVAPVSAALASDTHSPVIPSSERQVRVRGVLLMPGSNKDFSRQSCPLLLNLITTQICSPPRTPHTHITQIYPIVLSPPYRIGLIVPCRPCPSPSCCWQTV